MHFTKEDIENLFQNETFRSQLKTFIQSESELNEYDFYSNDELEDDSDNDSYDTTINNFTEHEIQTFQTKISQRKIRKTRYAPQPPHLEPYTLSDITQCESRIGFSLPEDFVFYITNVSKEIVYSKYGYNAIFNLDEITENTKQIRFNGDNTYATYYYIIQGKRKGNIYRKESNKGINMGTNKIYKTFREMVVKTFQKE